MVTSILAAQLDTTRQTSRHDDGRHYLVTFSNLDSFLYHERPHEHPSTYERTPSLAVFPRLLMTATLLNS